jgi:catechol 2,3-dioxygenase-like lactoylglutathione lyase family enzyme
MRIGLTSIFVDDQDQAERFSTQVLGFQVKTSAPYRPEERWLTVVSPEEPDGVELGAASGRRATAGVPAGQPPGRPAGAVAAH